MRLTIFLVVLGLALAYGGWQEHQLSSVAKAEPQSITCAELETKGAGDNANIRMTDFILCDQWFVYEENSSSHNWNKIWVPTLPLDGEYAQQVKAMLGPDGQVKGALPMPTNIRVIVKSTRIHSEQGLEDLGSADAIQGLVINRIESLGGEEARILAQKYPGTDFATCIILEEGRKPLGLAVVLGLLLGGLAISAAGVGYAIFRKKGPAAA